jgi:transmembrane sensor
MSRKTPSLHRQTLEEASAWFVEFRSAHLGHAAREDFQLWLKQSPDNIRAYLEIAAVYADVPPPETELIPADLIAKARSNTADNVIPVSAGLTPPRMLPASDAPANTGASSRTRNAVLARVFALAAAISMVAVGAWLYIQHDIYTTDIGEQRSITLEDGSMIELNAHTRIRVAYRHAERDIELLSGQALFQVARDPGRPFIVFAGVANVRAVGTQFDVYRRANGTTVTVLEGRVAVSSEGTRATPDSSPPLLGAGEQITVTPTRTQLESSPNVTAATAWTQHQLLFDDTPLSDVVAEFNRYNTRRLVVDSADLASLKISGQYTSTNPDSLLRFLSLQKGVLVRKTHGEIHISKE